MFTLYVIIKCLKEKVKPNIVVILFLMVFDFALLFSLVGLSKVKATDLPYSEGRAGDLGNGAYVYYNDTYCPIRYQSTDANNFCVYKNGSYIPSQEKAFIDHFYQAYPNYFTENYTIIFNRSSDYSDNYRCMVFPKANITSLTCTFEGLGDSTNGITLSGIRWNYAVTSGAKMYKGSANSTSFQVENWNNTGTWYCNGYTRCRYTGVCWNAYIPITNDLSNFAEGHRFTYYWDDRDFFIKKPYIYNDNTSLEYLSGQNCVINLNGSSTTDLTFQLYECDSNGNALTSLDWFFELSNLNNNSPYYYSNENGSGFTIPFYDFAGVNLKSGHSYNWSLIGTTNGQSFVIDRIIVSNVTWNNTTGVNNAIIESQNNTSTTLQNQTEWQQASASGDFNVSGWSAPTISDPTSNITNLFNNIVGVISNWEAEPVVLKIPTSQDGYFSPPYVLTIEGNYIEERLKWMWTTYDDMSVNPTHSGFILINIIKTIWWFIFGRWVYRIIRRIVDDIRSGKILDHNIEDITSNML